MNMSDPRITQAFAVPGALSIIDCINPETGRSFINGHTLEEIRARSSDYAGAVVVNLEDWMKAKGAEQDRPVTWNEVTKERYHEMLEVLPPAFWPNCGPVFMVGEAYDHHSITGHARFATFRKDGGKFYESSRPMRVSEVREFLGLRADPRHPVGDYMQ